METPCNKTLKRIVIPPKGSCTVRKNVNFVKEPEFKNWSENPQPGKWDRAWCIWSFSRLGDPFPPDDRKEQSGPILTHYIQIFKNPDVELNEIYKDLSFDYSIVVWANIEDGIELRVRNYTSGGWDKKGLKNYTEQDVYTNKTLTWLAVNLTIDNLGSEFKGRYKFVGSYSESSLDGHIGPTIKEEFYDPKVSYNETINKLSFDYEVTAWVNMIEDSIELQVYNYTKKNGEGDWEARGIRNYTRPGENQTLRWGNINLSCDHFDDHLRVKYRFVGAYESSSDITDPVIEEKFYSLDVTPREGTSNVTFNYSVTVNANICDKIELHVKNHTTGKWDTKETRDYIRPDTPDKNQTLKWHNISLNFHELNRTNDSKFRFRGICNASSSEKELPIWPIRPVFGNLGVKPERGLYTYEFNYSVNVTAEKGGKVKLLIFCPDGSLLYESYQEYNKSTEWQPLNWGVQLFESCTDKIGDARYKFEFWYKESEIINQTEEGPYIGIADVRNATVEPEIGTGETLLNYSVEVIAADRGKVELYTKCPKGTEWKSQGHVIYDTPKNWTLFKWTKIKLPCDSCGNAEYMFEFTPGFVHSKNYTGPEIMREGFGKLFVDPKEGTNYTLFNFSIGLNTSKPQNVTLWAKCDDGEWMEVESKPVVSEWETIKFSVKPLCDTFKEVCWKCKGIVSESEINCTKWDIGLNWINTSFSPTEGWWNDTFNFSVNLSANIPDDVELKVKCKDWKSVRNKSYYDNAPNPQMLTWEDVRICNNSYEGNTSYNFTFYWGNTKYPDDLCDGRPCDGPEVFIPLNIHLENNTVEPEEGVYYNFKDGYFRDTTNPLFNYSIEVTADKPTTLKLVLTDPCGEKHNMTEECKYTTPHQPQECSWTMIELPSGQAGKWNYTFLYYDTRLYYDTGDGWKMSNKTFEGPEIIAVFENYIIDPEPPIPYGKPCDVTVCMNGTEKINVTLEAFNLCPGYKNWTIIEPLKQYEPPGEECLNWTIDTFKVPFDKLRLIWKVI